MLETVKTIRFDIYMAGDISLARQVCREYCFEFGFCVHIEPVDFIYTGGEESGFKVGIINYPRFPKTERELGDMANYLAHALMNKLFQHSFSIVGPDNTAWFSRRDEGTKNGA